MADSNVRSIASAPTPFSTEVPELLRHHLDHLRDSAISIEAIRERGYRSILAKAELAKLGFSQSQCRVPGILMPIWSPAAQNTNHQLRPDQPRLNKDGKPVKYETPKGSGVCIDVPPRCRNRIGDPGTDLLVTEGLKKGDALASHGACAVGLMGVWGFLGRNLQGGITTLSEWRDIALNGRRVFIAYDSDVVLKRQVRQALDILCDFLTRRGADVWVIHLPSPDGSKVGIDNFLATHSLDDALRLARKPEETLRLSGGYRIEDGRTCRVVIERGGMEQVEPLSNFAAQVTEDITKDDGVEQGHYFQIKGELTGGQALPPVQVPASSFSNLNWVVSNWGVNAVIAAGQSRKDQLREAIQLMSLSSAKRTLYTHTGWRKVGGKWIFLSADASEVAVELPEGLKRYRLPQKCDRPKEAMQCSLRLLDIASTDITVPLLSSAYTAPLSEAILLALTIFLHGITGTLKTTLACLTISHFGGPFSRASVPATFESTENYLERLCSQAKDILLLIDDYYPQWSEAKARLQEQVAQRIIRAQSSHVGRGRLRADTSMRPTYSPKGLIIATGEMMPGGQSTAARMVVVEVSKDNINLEKLSQAQAEAGLYPEAMRSYVDWLSPQMDRLKEKLPSEFTKLRDSLRERYGHFNVAEMVAQLTIGWDLMLAHAVAVGAITEEQRDKLLRLGYETLIGLGERQEEKILAERPTSRFVDILRNLFAQKRAYLRDKVTGKEPEDYDIWGWEKRESDQGPAPFVPAGAELLGWMDEDLLYLLSEASYRAVARFAREQGEPFTVTKRTLHMQLGHEGILVPVDSQNIILKKISGGTHRLVQLDVSAFQR